MVAVAYRITSLPADPLAAAASFHADHVDRLQGALLYARSDSLDTESTPDNLVIVFPFADHTHRGWRLAVVQGLARKLAPLRINALVGDSESAIAAAVVYLEGAGGVTGQLFELDDTGAGEVLFSRP